MIHVISCGGTVKVFVNGILRATVTASLDLPAGHYKLVGQQLSDLNGKDYFKLAASRKVKVISANTWSISGIALSVGALGAARAFHAPEEIAEFLEPAFTGQYVIVSAS